MATIHEKSFKILIIGDGGVGKSTYITRVVQNQFIEQKITLGLTHELFSLNVNSSRINLMIWDLGGQKQFAELHGFYIRGVKAVIFCFDLARYQTFENLKKWKLLIDNSQEKPLVRILLGMKTDVPVRSRKITDQEITDLCIQYGFEQFYRCSSKEGVNIQEPFVYIANRLNQIA